jgi:hypothetical protein
MTIEHDVVCMGQGDIGTFGDPPGFSGNNQGSSAHGKSNIMVFGGLYEGCYGQGAADISQSGHNSASWYVGVISRDNAVLSGFSYGFYLDSTSGGAGTRAAWLDTCVSNKNVRDLITLSGPVYLYSCLLETQVSSGTGASIAAYDPSDP